MFSVYAEINKANFSTKADALAWARSQNFDSFEIRDEERDIQVYAEWPQPVWA